MINIAGSLDIYKIKEEMVVFLRNSDIISISTRGVTTTTDEFNGNGSTVDFTMTNSNVKNVRSVTVDASPKTYGTDYQVNYDTAVVTFTVAPGSGTDNVDIQYDYGNTDRIFPDFPQPHMKLKDFPRVAVDIISGTIREIALGGGSTEHRYMITIVCYSDKTEEIEDMVSTVQNSVIDNKKGFFYLGFLTPQDLGPVLNSPGKSDKILQRNTDFLSKSNFETV